jgi:uncharacterized protein YqgC (DUF456 family)
MEYIGWTLIILLFLVGMAGTIYPILPGVVAIYAAFLVYGGFFGFAELGAWFWIIQTLILVLIFVADYLMSALGIKKFGGSKAALWGSTIGLIVGPFVIPVIGLVLGPLLGAIIGELLSKATFGKAVKIGFISLLSLFSSMIVKMALQGIMIVYFLVIVLF